MLNAAELWSPVRLTIELAAVTRDDVVVDLTFLASAFSRALFSLRTIFLLHKQTRPFVLLVVIVTAYV